MADDAEVHSMGCAPAWWCGRPWNPSPLVRTSERMLFLLRAVVFGAIVLAVPLALTVGTEVYTDDVVRVRAEHASAVSVEATVLTEPEWTEAHDFEAQVRWDSGGAARTGTVPVPRTTDIGDRVSVWLDDQGAPTRAPRSPATAVFAGVGVAAFIMAAACLFGLGLIRVASVAADRRNAQQWDREWAHFDKPVTGDMS